MKRPSEIGNSMVDNSLEARRLYWLWPLLACVVGWVVIAKRLDHAVHFDAQYVYLPAARAFLENGWSYLLTSDSYRVVPLAYLWPALWGADPFWIRIANAGLWTGCVYFLWQISYLLGGHRAGIFAMLLWAFHPELPKYFASELTEPIFLFGLFGWMHVMAETVIQGDTGKNKVIAGAVMLTITLLSRPVLQLLVPSGILLCLGYIIYIRVASLQNTDHFAIAKCIALILSLSLVLPLALVIKNAIVFGLWGLGTGSGTGLYLGTHQLFQGAEPAFLGFNYDVNSLAVLKTGDGDHLSISGDRAARDAAIWQISSMTISDAVVFYARKLWWWLAHHPAQIESHGSSLRKIRIVELLLIIGCGIILAFNWRRRFAKSNKKMEPSVGIIIARSKISFVAFLAAILLLMLVQLAPILYNSRYSSALLDPYIIPLAAFSAAYMTASIGFYGTLQRNNWSFGLHSTTGSKILPSVVLVAIIAASTSLTYNMARKWDSIFIDPKNVGETLTHLNISSTEKINAHGLIGQGDHRWVITESPASMQVKIDDKDIEFLSTKNSFNALWATNVSLTTNTSKKCTKAEISYQTADGRILQPSYKLPLQIPLKHNAAHQDLVTHANNELRPKVSGGLRLVFHCPVGTIVEWHGTQFLESRYPWEAARHIDHR